MPSQKVGHTFVYNRPEYDRKLRSGVNFGFGWRRYKSRATAHTVRIRGHVW